MALTQDVPLSGRVGAGLDPCGALQTRIELAPDAEVEVVLLLGEAADEAGMQALIERYRRADLDAVLEAVTTQWADVLGTVQVRTPDRAMDVMLNHSVAVPDAGLPRMGAHRRSIRPAGRTASAISCRT